MNKYHNDKSKPSRGEYTQDFEEHKEEHLQALKILIYVELFLFRIK
jgi:hypothetical protein